MLLVEMQYPVREVGLQDVVVPREARPTPQIAEIIRATVKAWLDEEIEALCTVDIGHSNAKTMKAVKVASTRDKENSRRILYVPSEVKLEEKHILAAKFITRDPLGNDTDPETGEPFQPRVHVVCEDGSQADLPVDPKLLKKSEEKTKKNSTAA